jgi:hypothetical protein
MRARFTAIAAVVLMPLMLGGLTASGLTFTASQDSQDWQTAFPLTFVLD